MSGKTFSVRLQDDLIAQIRERNPKFDRSNNKTKGGNSDILRELIREGLGNDSQQEILQELAEARQGLRDIQNSVTAHRRNLTVVLELVLRNSGGPPEQVKRIIEVLQQKGLLA